MSTIAPPRPSSHRNSRANWRFHTTAGRLGAYTDDSGNRREVVSLSGAGGTRLLVDRMSDGQDDARLVAHLAADEPAENARTVCAMYLAAAHRRPCRPLTPEDFLAASGEGASAAATAAADTREAHNDATLEAELADRHGNTYRLEPSEASLSIPELRWRRYVPERQSERPQTVSLREVIGALESYEPALKLTLSAIEGHRHDPHVSVAVLRAEYERATASPIVLNRGLREAVQELLSRGGVSISEIAIRCGRVKHGPRGTVSGETSWLARRIGQLPEGGRTEPTPWVHTDVLALIARQGLHVSPKEVEV
jgi:hypothetical protein